MASRIDVFKAIDSERKYQNKKWPGRKHEIASYLTYIRDYLTEAEHIVSRTGDETEALDTIRKIAGMAVVCMEEHGAPCRPGFEEYYTN